MGGSNMSDPLPFALTGMMSRQIIPREVPLREGRRYRVWLRIREISQGRVCVWVGGNRGGFFTTAGEHIEEVAAGERQDVMVQGLDAVAVVDGLAVKEVAGQGE
jgi:hypothetical protein